MNNEEMKNECLAEKENGHENMYLSWVHQKDGTCYYKCEMCGWITYDDEIKKAKVEVAEDIENWIIEYQMEVMNRRTPHIEAIKAKCNEIIEENKE